MFSGILKSRHASCEKLKKRHTCDSRFGLGRSRRSLKRNSRDHAAPGTSRQEKKCARAAPRMACVHTLAQHVTAFALPPQTITCISSLVCQAIRLSAVCLQVKEKHLIGVAPGSFCFCSDLFRMCFVAEFGK